MIKIQEFEKDQRPQIERAHRSPKRVAGPGVR